MWMRHFAASRSLPKKRIGGGGGGLGEKMKGGEAAVIFSGRSPNRNLKFEVEVIPFPFTLTPLFRPCQKS
jgi:hypothetical protein